MVSIHKIPVSVLLIISVVCFIFRFKCGVDYVYLNEGCGKPYAVINDTIPHT